MATVRVPSLPQDPLQQPRENLQASRNLDEQSAQTIDPLIPISDPKAIISQQSQSASEFPATPSSDQLIVSPYTSSSHLLALSSVSIPNQLLARALTVLSTTRSDYATAPYTSSFNWSAVIAHLQALVTAEESFTWDSQAFFIVVFRSQIPLTTSRSHLGQLDKDSHEEATQSGGLLKYWFGTPDVDGRNLATCVWRNVQDAQVGGTGPGHRRAAKEARKLYTEWKIERLRLWVGEGAENWSITEWAN